jgi:hypothetical protein
MKLLCKSLGWNTLPLHSRNDSTKEVIFAVSLAKNLTLLPRKLLAAYFRQLHTYFRQRSG